MALIDDLIAHWTLDEASGTRADSHGSYDLAEVYTVGNATGKLGSAAEFPDSELGYLTASPIDDSPLGLGDTDCTIACWLKCSTTGGLLVNWVDVLGIYTDGDGYLVVNAGGTEYQCGTFTTGAWVFVVVDYRASDNRLRVHHAGTTYTNTITALSTADTIIVGDNVFQTGDKWVDSLSVWSRILTDDERTRLYNSGSGIDYADWGEYIDLNAEAYIKVSTDAAPRMQLQPGAEAYIALSATGVPGVRWQPSAVAAITASAVSIPSLQLGAYGVARVSVSDEATHATILGAYGVAALGVSASSTPSLILGASGAAMVTVAAEASPSIVIDVTGSAMVTLSTSGGVGMQHGAYGVAFVGVSAEGAGSMQYGAYGVAFVGISAQAGVGLNMSLSGQANVRVSASATCHFVLDVSGSAVVDLSTSATPCLMLGGYATAAVSVGASVTPAVTHGAYGVSQVTVSSTATPAVVFGAFGSADITCSASASVQIVIDLDAAATISTSASAELVMIHGVAALAAVRVSATGAGSLIASCSGLCVVRASAEANPYLREAPQPDRVLFSITDGATPLADFLHHRGYLQLVKRLAGNAVEVETLLWPGHVPGATAVGSLRITRTPTGVHLDCTASGILGADLFALSTNVLGDPHCVSLPADIAVQPVLEIAHDQAGRDGQRWISTLTTATRRVSRTYLATDGNAVEVAGHVTEYIAGDDVSLELAPLTTLQDLADAVSPACSYAAAILLRSGWHYEFTPVRQYDHPRASGEPVTWSDPVWLRLVGDWPVDHYWDGGDVATPYWTTHRTQRRYASLTGETGAWSSPDWDDVDAAAHGEDARFAYAGAELVPIRILGTHALTIPHAASHQAFASVVLPPDNLDLAVGHSQARNWWTANRANIITGERYDPFSGTFWARAAMLRPALLVEDYNSILGRIRAICRTVPIQFTDLATVLHGSVRRWTANTTGVGGTDIRPLDQFAVTAAGDDNDRLAAQHGVPVRGLADLPGDYATAAALMATGDGHRSILSLYVSHTCTASGVVANGTSTPWNATSQWAPAVEMLVNRGVKDDTADPQTPDHLTDQRQFWTAPAHQWIAFADVIAAAEEAGWPQSFSVVGEPCRIDVAEGAAIAFLGTPLTPSVTVNHLSRATEAEALADVPPVGSVLSGFADGWYARHHLAVVPVTDIEQAEYVRPWSETLSGYDLPLLRSLRGQLADYLRHTQSVTTTTAAYGGISITSLWAGTDRRSAAVLDVAYDETHSLIIRHWTTPDLIVDAEAVVTPIAGWTTSAGWSAGNLTQWQHAEANPLVDYRLLTFDEPDTDHARIESASAGPAVITSGDARHAICAVLERTYLP